MGDRLKLIGVCLSQAHSYLNTGLIGELDRFARPAGYRIVVFNSSLDFFWYQQGSNVARSMFSALDPSRFAALVIPHESFQDPVLFRRIVETASAAGLPVFCLGAVQEGCVSIVQDYYEAYKTLLRHVIADHGARDTFFLAGLPEEANSAFRLQCYREVLAECGLPCREENIAWGYYWEQPARDAVERLLQTRDAMPRAIFCANDTMALAVCETLKEHGLRVPEDIIVTGFDGIPAARLSRPGLTTCSSDPASLARLTVELVTRAQKGETLKKEYRHTYRPVFSESCGCPAPEEALPDPLAFYRRLEAQISHENQLYLTVERMLMTENLQELLTLLAHSILPDSAVYLNESFFSSSQDGEYTLDTLEPKLIRIPFRRHDEPELVTEKVSLEDLPTLSGEEEGVTIFTAIHSDSTVAGCYGVHTRAYPEDSQLIKRLSDVLNLLFTILLGNVRQRKLLTNLENSLYLDPLTGISNLQGLNRWFDSCIGKPANHERCLAFSVYAIHHYEYLQDRWGIAEAENILREVSRNLTAANPEAAAVARISESQFAVVNQAENEEAISAIINRSVRIFFDHIGTFNSRNPQGYMLEVNCGCTTLEPGWEQVTLDNLIHLATGEMYLNRMQSGSRNADRRSSSTDAAHYDAFRLLMEKNLFRFHFQPIVDARTGLICAYEALMRTDPMIQLNPLQILSAAREYNRLDEVEEITLFGIMERVTRNYGDFNNNKVFINTIPGHFLPPESCRRLIGRFDRFLDCFVFELTEEASTSDEELNRLKEIHKAGGSTQIAIDDYGTGHSNIVNLLRYSPQIIKIDRGLISGIATDSNKQLFVRNTIEFAHQNGIRVLAEGVETSQELRYVIEAGVDLIQGFYTARPAEQPLSALPEDIRNEILEENLRKRQMNRSMQIYTASDGETLHLIDLALRNYSVIHLTGGRVTLLGEKAHTVDMVIRIADGAEAQLVLDQVNIKGSSDTTIQLGHRSRLTLELRGENTLHKEGIRVPASASLRLTGPGSLTVHNNRNYCVGIGTNFNDPYGTIEVDMEGSLSFKASGDKVVCLGGGRSAGEGIFLRNGNIDLEANGINVICIGSALGPATVSMENGSLSLFVQGNDGVGIGALNGTALLSLRGQLNLTVDCERAVGVGVMSGRAEIGIAGGSLSSVLHCDVGTCIGVFSGEGTVSCRDAAVRVHGEGNQVIGIGAMDGSCVTRVYSGAVYGDLLAGKRQLLGNEKSQFVVFGGNIQLAEEETLRPVSPGGTPLHPVRPEGGRFEQSFREGDQAWTCIADRDESGGLTVWIP